MISDTEFAELGDSLAIGLFIDNVVMAIARTQHEGSLAEKDRQVVDGAINLLEDILVGERWLDEGQFDQRSTAAAVAFSRAVNALPSVRVTQQFTAHINNLKEITKRFGEEGTIADAEAAQLRSFFASYGRAVLTEGQRVVDRVSEPQGFRLWIKPPTETT